MTASNTINLAICKILFSCYRRKQTITESQGHGCQLLSSIAQVWQGRTKEFVFASPSPRQEGAGVISPSVRTKFAGECVGASNLKSETNMAEWYPQHATNPTTVSYGFNLVHSLGNKSVSCYQTVHGLRVKLDLSGEGMGLCFRMLF